MKKIASIITISTTLIPLTANAECVPVPDCASIGYTETSCDGGSVKCPFDSTKLKCLPCDSSFRYSCTGDNIKNPIGDTCNNKYTACECIAGATFTNGKCICDTSCDTIGNIYYSDGTCNSCKISDKIPVGIIAYKNESKHLIISLETNINMPWSTAQKDAEGNVIISWNPDLSGLYNYDTKNSVLTDSQASGLVQTRVIVEAYGENATGVAAVYCYNYAPTGLENTKGQWYLPAAGELYNVVVNSQENINKGFSVLEINSLSGPNHWSSSERNNGYAWYVSTRKDTGDYYKGGDFIVSCLLAIKAARSSL